MQDRLIQFIEKFVAAQRRATNQFALDGLADEAERLLAEVKSRAQSEWPKGWIYDRPFIGAAKRFRVVIQEDAEHDSFAIYSNDWKKARDWLILKGVRSDNIVSKTQQF